MLTNPTSQILQDKLKTSFPTNEQVAALKTNIDTAQGITSTNVSYSFPQVDLKSASFPKPNFPLPYIPKDLSLPAPVMPEKLQPPNPSVPKLPSINLPATPIDLFLKLLSLPLPTMPNVPPIPIPAIPIPAIPIPKPYSLNLALPTPNSAMAAEMVKTTLKSKIPAMITAAKQGSGISGIVPTLPTPPV